MSKNITVTGIRRYPAEYTRPSQWSSSVSDGWLFSRWWCSPPLVQAACSAALSGTTCDFRGRCQPLKVRAKHRFFAAVSGKGLGYWNHGMLILWCMILMIFVQRICGNSRYLMDRRLRCQKNMPKLLLAQEGVRSLQFTRSQKATPHNVVPPVRNSVELMQITPISRLDFW